LYNRRKRKRRKKRRSRQCNKAALILCQTGTNSIQTNKEDRTVKMGMNHF
jgi:hypothetical protein